MERWPASPFRDSPDPLAYRRNSTFQTGHSFLFPSNSNLQPPQLAPIQDRIHFWRVRFVVNHPAVDFDPRVGLERLLLRADDHLRRHTMLFQEARGGGGSLQAQRFFPIPDAGHVDGRADAFDRVGARRLLPDWISANLLVECREIAAGQVKVEMNQLQVSLKDKKGHNKDLRPQTGNC